MIPIRFLISIILITIILIMSVGIGAANEVTLTLEGITADELPNHAKDVYVFENYAYVADYTNGLVVVDISDTKNPITVGNHPSRIGEYGSVAMAMGVAVSGNYAYVANWYDDVYVIDISDRTNPMLVTTYKTGQITMDVTISGDYAFISRFDEGVDIVNISDPTNPRFISNFNYGWASNVAILQNYAYVADTFRVTIVDISDLANPLFVGSSEMERDAADIEVSGKYAYVADAENGLVILNISNPTIPTIVGHFDTSAAWGIALFENYVLISDGLDGIIAIDVSDPINPILAGSYDTPGYASSINIDENLAYVADDRLVILNIGTSSTSGLVHNINKGTDYTTIQAAIDDASPGDEIHVDSGTYYENVVVNKQLILRGIDTGAGMPVVDAGGSGNAIILNADGITLEGLMTINASASYPNSGIEVISSYNMLSGNTASNNTYGIYLHSSSHNTLIGNTASNNTDYGIVLSSSSNNTLSSNTVSNTTFFGIRLISSSNNTLSNNIVLNTTYYGIQLVSSSNNTLSSNTVSNTTYCGIRLYSSSNNNTLIGNTASNNDYGIDLDFSSINILYHNNLVDNTIYNANDTSGNNQWDSGTEGNYYSDYTGTDSNRDGIGDTPYNIPGGSSVDRYPLTGIRWLLPEINRSRLGINTHWNHWAEDLSVYKQKTISFGIVRDQAWWAGLETSDLTGSEWASANWNYSYDTETLCGKEITYQSGLDNLVKLYQDEDSHELLLLLNLKNDNISSFKTITAEQYYDYVYHVVERYDGDGLNDMSGLIRPVSYFEVGNEVDYIRTNDSRHGYLSPEDYVEKRLIPAYNAAKAANKDAIIMGSGLGMGSDLYGNDGQEFNTMYLDAMYDNITKNGGNKNNNYYMDKIAIHYYAKPNAEFDKNIKKVDDVIHKYENRDKPIWITEFYPLTEIGPCDTTTGAFARLLTLMFANRIEMPVIYNLKDDSESGFGLYDVTCEGDEETITPNESIQVIDTVLSTLHSTTPSETENENISIEPGKTTYKRVFNNSDKKVTVLWYIDTADPGAVTNYEVSPEPPQTFTVDVLGTANFSQTSPIHMEIGSEPTYVVEADLPIDVDLYFNRTTTAGVSTERATSFAVGDTLYGKIKTSTSTDHLVKTYFTITMPDGTCRYAYYDKPDFTPGIDRLLFSDKKVQLYDGVWQATTDDWLWNIYEFTGGDSGIYAWNCWYEDSETSEILGGNSTEYTFSTTPSGTPVNSATGKGEVYLDSSAGTLENLVAISPDDMPAMPESLNPVYGFFSFNVTGISGGQSVNIPLAFPDNVPEDTEYWKYGSTLDNTTPHWYQIPVGDDDGDRIIVITLTDGGIGDDDLAVNGVIVDDGGPSLPLTIDIKPPFSITNLHSTAGTTWINWTWTNPPDPDFNHTELHLNGIYITNIPAPQNYYKATGLLPDTSYELSTHTVDTSGNINLTWVNDTASTLPASGTTLNLYTGWNLISLPLIPEDTSITSLLSPINGNYSIVWAYNASDTADHWKKYDPGAPFGNDLTTMEPGKGYWIMMTSNDTLFVTGDVPGSTDIILKAGWNLIGYNSLVGQPIENALASVSSNYSIVWAYNASDTADHWKKYDPGAPFGNDLANLESGSGYWIMMTSDDILEI